MDFTYLEEEIKKRFGKDYVLKISSVGKYDVEISYLGCYLSMVIEGKIANYVDIEVEENLRRQGIGTNLTRAGVYVSKELGAVTFQGTLLNLGVFLMLKDIFDNKLVCYSTRSGKRISIEEAQMLLENAAEAVRFMASL